MAEDRKDLEMLVNDLVKKVKLREMTEKDSEIFVKATELAMLGLNDVEYGLKISRLGKGFINQYITKELGADFFTASELCRANKFEVPSVKATWDLMLLEAPHLLDSFWLYVEKNKPAEKQLYLPRRKTLKTFVDALQEIEEDKLDILFLHCPPRVGKSLTMTFGSAWHCARNPDKSNLYITYKESLGGSFVNSVQEIISDPTYCFADVFPNVNVVNTDAKNHKLDLVRKKKYWSLSGKGLESGLNGEYDAEGWFLCDDLLEGIQDAMNPETMRRKQTVFDNNALSRVKENCKEIYNGTIWSLHDIFSNRVNFLQNDEIAKQKRLKIIKIPALNENDESNFDYDYGQGFSTKYYLMKRSAHEEQEDMASFLAQYQQEPIERDGQVFQKESMKFYNGELPAEEPLKVVVACDVALGGKDYLSCPLAVVYEDGSVYIHDVVFDNNEKNITQPRVVDMIMRNGVTSGFFEANQGGEGYKDDIDRLLKEKGYRCNLTSAYAPTSKRKEQRIWDSAPDIREFYFRDVGCRSPQYTKFMTNLYSFTVNGKNRFDDAPDSLATLCDYIYRGSGVKVAKVMKGFF